MALGVTASLLLIQFFWIWHSYYGNVGIHGNDGQFYYAWLSSSAIDHDLDFENEIRDHDPLHHISPARFDERTADGHLANRTGIGTAVLWLPFFGLACAGSALLHLPIDGYNWLFQLIIPLGSILYGFAALWLTYLTGRLVGTDRSAAFAVSALALGSTIAVLFSHYQVLSHLPAMCLTSGFCWLIFRAGPRSTRIWVMMGLTVGVLGLVRFPAVIVAVALPVHSWMLIAAAPTSERGRVIRAEALGCAIAGSTSVLAFMPQLFAWRALFGAFFVNSYKGAGEIFDWASPHLLETLFSTNHGLLVWTPLVGLGLAGLVYGVVVPKSRMVCVPLLSFFVAQIYMNGCTQWWNFGEVFGNRGYSETFVASAVGLCFIIDRQPKLFAVPTVAMVMMNQMFIWAWQNNFHPTSYSGVVRGWSYGVLRAIGHWQ